jgi:sugar/nucleoside kinase (ribokinase family)
MMYCRRVSVLDTNGASDGRVARHAHLRTHQSPATVALAFASMCAIIAVVSTCRLLI